MNLDDLLGKTVGFHGVDCNVVCLSTADGDRVAFEAVEDQCDGYRSMLDEVKHVSLRGGTFFREPIVEVTIRKIVGGEGYDSFSGYELTDGNGHVWLRLGTSNWDDYYPYFVFEYSPSR